MCTEYSHWGTIIKGSLVLLKILWSSIDGLCSRLFISRMFVEQITLGHGCDNIFLEQRAYFCFLMRLIKIMPISWEILGRFAYSPLLNWGFPEHGALQLWPKPTVWLAFSWGPLHCPKYIESRGKRGGDLNMVMLLSVRNNGLCLSLIQVPSVFH